MTPKAMSWRQFASLLASLLLLAQQLCANVDPKKGRVTDNPNSGNRYTIDQEVQLGRQGVAEIEKQLKLLPSDHPMSRFINQLGQMLAAKAPGHQFPYTFRVVREKSINAFALPGGPIYVHTGLIEAASESELAAVMGHEISHVVMRHSTRQASRAMKAQLPLAILGGVLGAGVGGWAGSLGQMGASLVSGSVMMKYSRDAETEADMVGAQIMYDAGYNPQAAVSFFNKLAAQSGDRSAISGVAPGSRKSGAEHHKNPLAISPRRLQGDGQHGVPCRQEIPGPHGISGHIRANSSGYVAAVHSEHCQLDIQNLQAQRVHDRLSGKLAGGE